MFISPSATATSSRSCVSLAIIHWYYHAIRSARSVPGTSTTCTTTIAAPISCGTYPSIGRLGLQLRCEFCRISHDSCRLILCYQMTESWM
jgi:hypothetical protein